MNSIKNLQSKFLIQSVEAFQDNVTPATKSYFSKMGLALGTSVIAVCANFMFSSPVRADDTNADQLPKISAEALKTKEIAQKNLGDNVANLVIQCVNQWVDPKTLTSINTNLERKTGLDHSFSDYRVENEKLNRMYSYAIGSKENTSRAIASQEWTRNSAATTFLADCGTAVSLGLDTTSYQSAFKSELKANDELRNKYQTKDQLSMFQVDNFASEKLKEKSFREFVETMATFGLLVSGLGLYIMAPGLRKKNNKI